jgi:hypothetical protein
MLIMVVVLLVATHMFSLLAYVIPVVPMLMMLGSGVLGAIELFLLFGSSDDRKLAKRELKWLWGTFLISGVLWRISSLFLLKL